MRGDRGEQVDFEAHHLVGDPLRIDVITAIVNGAAHGVDTALVHHRQRADVAFEGGKGARGIGDVDVRGIAGGLGLFAFRGGVADAETGAPPPTCTGRPSIPLILFAIAHSPRGIYDPLNGPCFRNFRPSDEILALSGQVGVTQFRQDCKRVMG